jgi:hypothetical protein
MNVSKTSSINYEEIISSIKDLVFRKKKKLIHDEHNDPRELNVRCEDDENWETSPLRNHTEVKNWLKWHEDLKTKSAIGPEPVITPTISKYLKLVAMDGWDLADRKYVRDCVSNVQSSSNVFRSPGVYNSERREIDMQGSSILGLNDTLKPEVDTDVATVGFVKRKLASIVPETNLNLLCSQGYKGKADNNTDVYRFFPAGVVFEDRVKIAKVSLTTTKDSVENVQHVLRLITVPIGSSSAIQSPEIVLKKPGSSLYQTSSLENKFLQNSTAHFELQSFINERPTTIFAGEATLTLQIIV